YKVLSFQTYKAICLIPPGLSGEPKTPCPFITRLLVHYANIVQTVKMCYKIKIDSRVLVY
uniref:hypothetical protein n=1 Tax=Prevotella sp. TaxID=59823 RepID=UPI0040270CEE